MFMVLGLDPGFANLGWTVAEIHGSGIVVKALGSFETQKSNKKNKILATHDNFRRTKEISKFITAKINQYSPKIICVESMSFPRNASAAAKVAYCWGALAALVETYNIAVLQVSPQELKVALTGSNKASKEDIMRVLDTKYGKNLLNECGIHGIPKTRHEHAYDSLAAIEACKDSDLIKIFQAAERNNG